MANMTVHITMAFDSNNVDVNSDKSLSSKVSNIPRKTQKAGVFNIQVEYWSPGTSTERKACCQDSTLLS